MKTTISLLLLIVLLIPASAVYAFDVPSQSTDNATDVILWPGTSIPVIIQGSIGVDTTANVSVSSNITITSLGESITTAAEAHAEVLKDSMENISSDWLSFFIVAFILLLVFRYGGIILYALGMPVAFVYGFVTASEATVFSPLWVAGVAIGILGIYFLFQIASGAFKKGQAGGRE